MSKPEKKFVDDDLQGAVEFLNSTSEKIIDTTRNVDSHANVLLGLGMAVFALAINEMMTSEKLHITFSLIAFFSGVSSIVALLAIRPPRFLIKKGQKESLMYTREIASFESSEKYAQALKKTVSSDDSLFNEFATEIYNLSRYYYLPKRKLFSLSRNIFLFGVVLSLFVLLLEVKFKLNIF